MIHFAAYSLFFLLSFCLAAALAALAWGFWQTWKKRSEAEPSDAQPGLLRDEVLSTLSVFAALLARIRYVGSLKRTLAEADIDWSVGRVVLTMLVCGAVTLNVFLRLGVIPVFGAWILAGVGAAAPIFYIHFKRRRRLRAVEQQLPEALDFLSRALIAGHSLPMSLEMLAEETDPPFAEELRKVVDEYNLGMSMNDALRNLGDRLPTVDIEFFVSAISTQSRTGGNLHELLDTLSETIRERQTLKGQVRALTANGRLTAIVLSLLPFVVAGILMVVNKDYFLILVNHPLGKTLLFLAMCGQGAAYFVIKKIVDIKV